jgi:transposase-like protein
LNLENETEMQELRLDMESRGYSKSAGPFCIYNSAYGITCHSPKGNLKKKTMTTNGLERKNKELKRRIRVVGAFPCDQTFMGLSASILMDINEDWMLTKKYLSMDTD